jgi:hypothetical protein
MWLNQKAVEWPALGFISQGCPKKDSGTVV